MNIIPLIKDYRKEFLEIAVRKGFVIFDYEKSFKIMKSESIRLNQIIKESINILHRGIAVKQNPKNHKIKQNGSKEHNLLKTSLHPL